MSKRRSLMTPKGTKGRKSMLGFSSAAAKSRCETPAEAKRLTFSSARKGLGTSSAASVPCSASRRTARWSSVGAPVKDTRPLTSKPYQRLMVNEIIEFLNESGYPHLITVKILSAPTTKEFLRVFEHLYNFILPNFSLDQKKYSEEIPVLLKNMYFPFQISKTTMLGMGSMHAWPTLLGVLHWLVELIRTTSSIDIEQVLFPPSLQEDSNNIHKQVFFEHSAMTYAQFMLNGQEDFSEENKVLKYAAMHLAGCSSEDNDALELEVSALEDELADLETEPDILSEALKHKTDLEDYISQSHQAINEFDQQEKCLQLQHAQYSAQVKEEGIIIQLGDTTKQDTLKRKSSEIELQVDRLKAEKERLEQQNDEREVKFARLYNKFSAAATEYNDIAVKLMTNTYIQQNIGEESIKLHFAHSRAILNDYKIRLKPLLANLSHQITDYRFKLEAKKIEMENELDKNKEELSTKRDIELVRLKDELTHLEKELEGERELVEKKYASSLEEFKQIECVLDKKQKESTDIFEEDNAKLDAKKKTCDELHEKQLHEQNSALQSLLKFGQKVIEHKEFVEDQIDKFNNYVCSQIEVISEEKKAIALLSE